MLNTIGIYRSLATGAILIGIIGYIWYTIFRLKSEIANNKIAIEKLNSEVTSKKLVIINRDNTIKVLNDNIFDLNKTINKSNDIILANSIDLAKKQAELIIWENKPPLIKYKTIYEKIPTLNYAKATCEEGLSLNKAISEMNYDEL